MARTLGAGIGGGKQRPARLPRCRQGMTLVEVLVAMSILLLGVWGVAVGFPRLLGLAREEDRRTQMGRLTQAALDRLIADPQGLPMFICAPSAAGSLPGDVSPLSVPEDPEARSLAENPRNSRDDWISVYGEKAVIPGVQPGAAATADVIYLLKVGRADVAYAPSLQAYELYPVEEPAVVTSDPLSAGAVHLDSDGNLRVCVYPTANTGAGAPCFTELELSYSWRDTAGNTHSVNRCLVALPAPAPGDTEVTVPVPAVSLTALFDTAVAGSASGYGRVFLTYAGVGTAPAPGAFNLDSTGAMLLFNQADSGRTVQIDYNLQRDLADGRRVPEVWEEKVLSRTDAVEDTVDPTYSFVPVQLTANGLQSQTSLLNTPGSTHVLAVDQTTGATYTGSAGLQIDYDRARVLVHLPDTALGHLFRFYYRSEDDAMFTIVRPRERYWPADEFAAADLPAQAHRVYTVDTVAVAPATYTVLSFTSGVDPVTSRPTCTSAGTTVSVDYLCGDPAAPQRVIGELHTLPSAARSDVPTRAFAIVLNQPDVLSIAAVRGVSLRVRGWWLAASGRLQHVDVDTLLSPAPSG